MAEYDNAGFPISYALLSTATSIDQGKRKKALAAWALCVKDKYAVNPVFTHVDKDMAEISMAKEVWKSKINLCWWHLRRAVRTRLSQSKLSTTPYNVQRAHTEFSVIDVQFIPPGKADAEEFEGGLPDDAKAASGTEGGKNVLGVHLGGSNTLSITIPAQAVRPSTSVPESTPIPNLPHHDAEGNKENRLECSNDREQITIKIPPLRTKQASSHCSADATDESEGEGEEAKKSRRTFCAAIYRQPIVKMMENHYCAHPLIPGYAHPSPEGIRKWAVLQMYKFCVEHNLREVWAYLWENWYPARPLGAVGTLSTS